MPACKSMYSLYVTKCAEMRINMNIEEMSVNAIRVLSADAIQKANSGHPGLPLGTAPIAYELFSKHMNYNPQNQSGLTEIDSFFQAVMVLCFYILYSIFLE